ncbi:multidrug efflux SMR transporter [Paenibacillus polymyxa]|uniref:DMT family transporter n=1 Tax=Paenibacillus polymyxa TaxID=1406 RepID=UPI002ED53351|nr:multidrug efflux SMR transporter [Paenibacillus polymyxa]
MNRSWLLIIIGVVFEVIWVTGFKHSENWIDWTMTVLSLIISFTLVIIASAKLPVGTVYAVFTGLGTVGTVLIGMILFEEPVQILKLIFIVLLISGVIGLKLVGSTSRPKVVDN